MTEFYLDPLSMHLGLESGSQVYSVLALRSWIDAHILRYIFVYLDCKAGSKEVNISSSVQLRANKLCLSPSKDPTLSPGVHVSQQCNPENIPLPSILSLAEDTATLLPH